jgi:HK97 gp10 family phage protein
MAVKIIIEGIEDATNFLKNSSKEILKKADDAIKQAGFFIEEEVKASIAGRRAEPKSVDTGRFLNSVNTKFPGPLTASVESDVTYAKYLEFGTSKIQPRHHFTNTKERNIQKIKEFVEKHN